jgi:hypothetical protein
MQQDPELYYEHIDAIPMSHIDVDRLKNSFASYLPWRNLLLDKIVDDKIVPYDLDHVVSLYEKEGVYNKVVFDRMRERSPLITKCAVSILDNELIKRVLWHFHYPDLDPITDTYAKAYRQTVTFVVPVDIQHESREKLLFKKLDIDFLGKPKDFIINYTNDKVDDSTAEKSVYLSESNKYLYLDFRSSHYAHWFADMETKNTYLLYIFNL